MHDNNPNVQTLNLIYQSSKMGVDSISALLPKTENPEMKKELANRMLSYHNFAKTSSQKLYDIHHYPHDTNPFVKIPAFANIYLKTAVDSSDSHIAEMMIQGSAMGVVQISKQLNSHKNLTQEVEQLGQEIVSFEQDSINKMRGYL